MKTIQTSAGQIDLDEVVQALLQLKMPDLKGVSDKLMAAIEQHDFGKYSKRERELIRKIKTGGPSEELWKKHDELLFKSYQGTMTDEDNQEFLKIVPVFDQWAVERAKLMIELARLWNVSVDKVFKRTGYQTSPLCLCLKYMFQLHWSGKLKSWQMVVVNIANICNVIHQVNLIPNTFSPHSLGGTNELLNLAKACDACNGSKHTAISAPDPLTNQAVPLFHPRKDNWHDHFKWSDDLLRMEGLTPIGRATIARLKTNRPAIVNLRRVLIGFGHPPD